MKTYTVTWNGVDHTVQLSDEDAKRYGAKEYAPENKQVRPANKSVKPNTK